MEKQNQLEKQEQRRFKAKLALIDCDLGAARKMVYDLDSWTMAGFRMHMDEIHKISEEVLRLISEEVHVNT